MLRAALLLIVWAGFPLQNLFAQVVFESPRIQKKNFLCEEGGLCEFEVQEQTYKVIYSSPEDVSWGTRMFAKYKTTSLKGLEEYAVVQFIKGCMFQSEMKDGQVKYYANYKREFFDEIVLYKHAQFQIDSVDKDYMYNNTPEGFEHWNTRHGLYRWNRESNSYDQKTEVLFYKEKPMSPELYVVDRPGTAFYVNKTAKNISLQFKTCLYKTKDVPKNGSPDDTQFAGALVCFDWSSSFIYNFEKNIFERPSGIHPFCS